MWSSREANNTRYNGSINTLPQQPGQLMQNVNFTTKKSYAQWPGNVSDQRSRETELLDLLLVNNAIKKPVSLPQLIQQKSISPELTLMPKFSIPLHPQHQSFSPYPYPSGYPLNQQQFSNRQPVSPQYSQEYQPQFFPSNSAVNQQQAFLPNPYISSTLKNQSEVYSHIKNAMSKQNEYQQKFEQQKLQLKLLEDSLQKKKYVPSPNLEETNFLSERHSKQRYFQVPPIIKQVETPQQFLNPPMNKKKKRKQKLILQLNIIKEITDINKIKNNNLESDSQISSEPSVEYVQKQRRQRLKPVPKPKYVDLEADETTMKNLITLRTTRNLKRFFIKFSYLIYKLNDIKRFNREKKEKALNEIPQLQNNYKDEMVKLSSQVSEAVISQMMKEKVNFRVVESADKRVSPSQLQNNSIQLKLAITLVFKMVMQTQLQKQLLDYLNKITQNNEYLLSNYHVRFELSRLNYSLLGTVIEMTPGRQKMMLVINFWIKYFLLFSFPESQNNIQKISEIMVVNLKTITSALYEIALQFCKGQAQPILNNTKLLPLEVITKERTENYATIKAFSETQDEITFMALCQQQKSDEPLLHPLFTAREMENFFDSERKFIGEIIQYLDGWSVGILKQIEEFRLSIKNERQNELKQQLSEFNVKIIETKKKNVQQIMKDSKAAYMKWCSEIRQLKQKIQEGKEKNEKLKKEYEENVKQQQARQEQLMKLGI